MTARRDNPGFGPLGSNWRKRRFHEIGRESVQTWQMSAAGTR